MAIDNQEMIMPDQSHLYEADSYIVMLQKLQCLEDTLNSSPIDCQQCSGFGVECYHCKTYIQWVHNKFRKARSRNAFPLPPEQTLISVGNSEEVSLTSA